MKNQKKIKGTNKLPMGRKLRKGFAIYAVQPEDKVRPRGRILLR